MPEPIVYTEHAQDVLARAIDAFDAGQRFVLVQSVDIQGGAAREVGSLAVVTETGRMYGYMSNGCIDRDIQLQALTLLETGAPAKVLRYGEGSPFADLTLPCGGALELLLTPCPPEPDIRAAYAALCARQPADLALAVPDRPDGSLFRYDPKPRMSLAGRGAVFRSTARVANEAGFEVQAYSPDAADLGALAELPGLTTTELTTPTSVPRLELDAHSAFLTLFHDHEWELFLLKSAIETPARFIGCLGSRKTHDMRRQALLNMGCNTDAVARIHGPIGLVPSLRQAQLIGISAVAEVMQSFSKSIHKRSGL